MDASKNIVMSPQPRRISRKTRNIAMTVRAAVLDLLRAFRMTSIFGNPGSTELPLFRGFP